MSNLDREPSFVEGLDQGYELGYLKALKDIGDYIAELRENIDADDMVEGIPFMDAPDFSWMDIRMEE